MKPPASIIALTLLLTAAAPAAAQSVPFIPLSDFLPPLVPGAVGEDHREDCGADGVACLQFVEDRLAEWEAFFGCDHRAVFPTVYRLLTREARLAAEQNPEQFDDPAGLGFEAVLFYRLFEEMITAQLAGEPIPPAWQTAMDAAGEGDWTALHDMLLAINAHVQRDMPFAVAAVGLRLPDGSSRKRDHDQFNRVLNDAYAPIVEAVGRRYDPLVSAFDASAGPVDNLAAQQLIVLWREGVWRNAERLDSSAGGPLFDTTVTTIELQAELSAQLLKTGPVPGRRALRRAHCEARLAEERDAAEAAGLPVGASGSGGGVFGYLFLLLGLLRLPRSRRSLPCRSWTAGARRVAQPVS